MRLDADILHRLLPPYSRLWRAVLSAIVALALVVGDYLLDNYPYPVLDDVDSLAFIELMSERVAHQTDDSVLYLSMWLTTSSWCLCSMISATPWVRR